MFKQCENISKNIHKPKRFRAWRRGKNSLHNKHCCSRRKYYFILSPRNIKFIMRKIFSHIIKFHVSSCDKLCWKEDNVAVYNEMFQDKKTHLKIVAFDDSREFICDTLSHHYHKKISKKEEAVKHKSLNLVNYL